jgi:hypothetical protein
MPTYMVDSGKQMMVGTGLVNEAAEMVQSAAGAWSNAGQARCKGTGFPLWDVEVMYTSESYGKKVSVMANVTVPGVEQPVLVPYAPVQFVGLVVSVSAPKGRPGSLSERWSAESLVPAGAGSGSSARRAAGAGSGSSGGE